MFYFRPSSLFGMIQFDEHIFSDEWRKTHQLPWEPKTFIFRGYDPYIEGVKPPFFMVLGSPGSTCCLSGL